MKVIPGTNAANPLCSADHLAFCALAAEMSHKEYLS
jgi:hypothetical protein